MKALSIMLATAALALLTAQNAQADSVRFVSATTGGNGCPTGSVAPPMITPDGTTMSLLFDNYIASPGNKSCNVAIATHVPNGFQVSLITADFRGWIEGSGRLYRDYFFAGSTGPSLQSNLSSPNGQQYLKQDSLHAYSNVYSKCGQDVILRINTRIKTNNNKSSISVDTLDIKKGLTFHLQYQPC